ncbi:MAG: NYN domain-containing protein [Promethearchaeota archaeon]
MTPAFFNMRTYIYIDGFNLYHLALEKSNYKWLDFKKLFVNLLNEENDIIKIKYYTAYSSGKFDQQKPARQIIYHNALKKHIPEIEIVYGKFKTYPIKRSLVSNPQERVEVYRTEEKYTDVNLAVQIVNDGWKDLYDCAILLSNDADFTEALRVVNKELGLVVGLVTPRQKYSVGMKKNSSFKIAIKNKDLRDSQLPNPIPNSSYHKPESW